MAFVKIVIHFESRTHGELRAIITPESNVKAITLQPKSRKKERNPPDGINVVNNTDEAVKELTPGEGPGFCYEIGREQHCW
jgi:hypothetical protein